MTTPLLNEGKDGCPSLLHFLQQSIPFAFRRAQGEWNGLLQEVY